jgi:hypothetical protein
VEFSTQEVAAEAVEMSMLPMKRVTLPQKTIFKAQMFRASYFT